MSYWTSVDRHENKQGGTRIVQETFEHRDDFVVSVLVTTSTYTDGHPVAVHSVLSSTSPIAAVVEDIVEEIAPASRGKKGKHDA
jgi:hypothetical protein